MRLFSSSLIYVGTSLLNKAIPFLFIPVLTKIFKLTPAEYGTLAIFQLFVALLIPFMNFNINLNVSRKFHVEEKEYMSKLIGNSLLLVLLAFILFTLVITGLSTMSSIKTGVPTKWLLVTPLISFTSAVNTANLAILRNQNKPLAYGILEVFKTILSIGVTVLAMVLLSMRWEGRALGIIVAHAALAAISLYMMVRSKYISLQFESEIIKDTLKFALPLIPFSLGAFIINYSDRLFIENIIGSTEQGIYSVAYSFGTIIMLVSTSFIKAWSPWFFKALSPKNEGREENKYKVVKFSYGFFLALLFIVLVVSVSAPWIIPLITTKDYSKASDFVYWIALGYLMQGMYNMLYQYLVIIHKTMILGVITIIAAIVNVILNYYMIHLNGTVGAAQSTFIAFTLIFVTLFVYAQKHYPMPWLSFSRILK